MRIWSSNISVRLSKGRSFNYHDVGRFWGASSNMKPDFTIVDPCSYPENEKEMVVETIRIITRLHDKKVDQYKSLRLEYEAILRRIGAAEEGIVYHY